MLDVCADVSSLSVLRSYTHAIADLDAGMLPQWTVRACVRAHHDTNWSADVSPDAQNMPAPDLSKTYWRLKDTANMRDLLLAVRADEAWCVARVHVSAMCLHALLSVLMRFRGRVRSHSHVNHTLASLGEGAKNPFRKGHTTVPHDFVQPPPGVDMRTGAAAQ